MKTRAGKKVKKNKLLSKMYAERDDINVFYFGGKKCENGESKKPKFVSKHNQDNLDKLWMPFYKNMYCRYSENVKGKDRWKINEKCVVEYEKWKKEGCEYSFKFEEASSVFPKPVAFTKNDHKPLYETSLYLQIFDEIPKNVRKKTTFTIMIIIVY